MNESLRGVLVRPFVKRWLASSADSWRSLPRPVGAASAQAAGPNPDRLLLVGSGIAVGYGALSHDTALAGQLARQLSEITGRGAKVDVLVTEEMTGHDISVALNRKWLHSVDIVIATPGDAEMLLLHSPAAWREQIASLLDHVLRNAPASLHVFIVGLPPLPAIVRMPRLLGFFARRSARLINVELERLCLTRTNTTFIPFEPTELAGRTGTGRTYQSWAALIVPTVAAELDAPAPLTPQSSAPLTPQSSAPLTPRSSAPRTPQSSAPLTPRSSAPRTRAASATPRSTT